MSPLAVVLDLFKAVFHEICDVRDMNVGILLLVVAVEPSGAFGWRVLVRD